MGDASVAPVAMEGGKKSKWLAHVKKTMKAHKGKSFKAVLKMAKKTYRGGAAEPYTGSVVAKTASAVGGRRKTKRGTRKH